MPELEAELAALRTRAEQAEASASQLEETLKVGMLVGTTCLFARVYLCFCSWPAAPPPGIKFRNLQGLVEDVN